MANVMIGCDPELFLRKDNSFVSAYGLIPGTKEAPHAVKGGAVQVDGMSVEFNINPTTNIRNFKARIKAVRKQLEAMLHGYEVVSSPIAHFDEAYMRSQPEEALELGCDPDYNAYTGEANTRPDGNVFFRTAGGHVHVGWTTDAPLDHPDHVEACRMLARELDYYLGVPSLFWDNEDGRRAMYGKAGAFRSKSYGMEYRSLSNAWLKDELIMEFVFKQTQKAFKNLADGTSLYNKFSNAAQRAMNDSHRELGGAILRHETSILEGVEELFERITGE